MHETPITTSCSQMHSEKLCGYTSVPATNTDLYTENVKNNTCTDLVLTSVVTGWHGFQRQ